MRFSMILAALLSITSQIAYADCKTVMGGCTTEEAVNVAPHMRADNNKPLVKAESAAKASNKVNNANISANNKQKENTKKI
ncbi:MAG: hypothetical protein SFU55_02925 [Methylophilus sp.]|nr:hypothetical protein [Methylophilus sp.]